MKSDTIRWLIMICLLLLTVLALPIINATHFEHGKKFTVTGKAVVGAKGKYLIYNENTTYEIEDSIIYWRWNSSDVYGKIEVGKTYTATLQGYRIPIFSMYPNIINPVEVKSND